jgi:hypothetical protein
MRLTAWLSWALAALPRVLLAALLLALAGRAGQFHAAGVDRQCCGGVLPLICASVAWRHVLWVLA